MNLEIMLKSLNVMFVKIYIQKKKQKLLIRNIIIVHCQKIH